MNKERKWFFILAPIPLLVIAGIMLLNSLLETVFKSATGEGASAVAFILDVGLEPLAFFVAGVTSVALLLTGITLTFRAARRKESVNWVLLATLLPATVVVMIFLPFIMAVFE